MHRGGFDAGRRPPVGGMGLAVYRSAGAERLIRISMNLIGAAGAAFFAEATLRGYLQTHRPLGAAFCRRADVGGRGVPDPASGAHGEPAVGRLGPCLRRNLRRSVCSVRSEPIPSGVSPPGWFCSWSD